MANSFLRKVRTDPLVHFLILGVLMYAAVTVFGGQKVNDNEIVVSATNQKHIADLFEITWQRPASEDELKNLIEDHIKEEVYYREALYLGLDDNDTIVRRRMRQKLEFMQEDLSSLAVPTDTQVHDYYTQNKDQYKTSRILSFKQVLVSSKRGGEAEAQTAHTLDLLKGGADPKVMSRSTLLPVTINSETEKSVTNTFGADFLAQISSLKTGEWAGPVVSGFGTHLVYVSLDQATRSLDFDTARAKVEIDYRQSRRAAAAENYYKNLRAQYRVTIEDAP